VPPSTRSSTRPSTHIVGIQPGDVLAVRTPPSVFGTLIRFGAWLHHQPDHVDHVVVAHHRDAAGTLWGVEGRPGGVGWVDIATYDNRWLVSNAAQYKTADQRRQVCTAAAHLLGVGYDWAAIGVDAVTAVGFDHLWRAGDFGGRPPAHVVCSSLASWVYRRVGLAEPVGPQRYSTPADWAAWMIEEGWRHGAA
jgi:hypothetical protein